MKYIIKTLDFLDYMIDNLNIKVDNNSYSSAIKEIYALGLNENFKFSNEQRQRVVEYLKSLEIEKEKNLITHFKGISNDIFDNFSKEDKSNLDYTDLEDYRLLRLLGLVLKTVNFVQKDNLLLLKYSKSIWNTGWHNLAINSRGKVIDLNTHEIVVYPFNKFFNLNEVEDTKEDIIIQKLEKAKKIYVTDKKDGTAIIVTKYKGKLIINTNGEFENIQIQYARELLNNKYSYFEKNVPEGFTFVFELIHPDNKIVLDYGKEKKLYLLAVRDLKTLKLLDYQKLEEIAKQYYLDITESFKYTNLYDFISKASLEIDDIKEGWVFRIVLENEDFLFKLKYSEYFKLAKIKNIPSLKNIYKLLLSDNLDDILSTIDSEIDSEIKENVLKNIELIYKYIESFKSIIAEKVNGYKIKYQIEQEIKTDDIKEIVQDLKNNPFSSYILRVLKGSDLDDLFIKLPSCSSFEKLYKYTNDFLNIKEDIWNLK